MAGQHSGRRPAVDILAMYEVVEDFFLGDEIGGVSKYSISKRMARE